MLNPEMVITGGEAMRFGPAFTDAIQSSLGEFTLGKLLRRCRSPVRPRARTDRAAQGGKRRLLPRRFGRIFRKRDRIVGSAAILDNCAIPHPPS